MSREPLERAVSMINKLNADLVLFTGDLVNNKTDEAFDFVPVLKKIKAKKGVFSVLGNHDYGDYAEWPSEEMKKKNMDKMYQVHKEMGWDLLLNENRVVEENNESIDIIGVENWSASNRFPKYGDLKKAHQETSTSFKILLSHDPSHFDAQVNTEYQDIDLTLSGHTHGMQFGVEIPGFKWSPSQWVYKQWAGLYSKKNQYLYVNRGLGFLGYPGRVGIWPEITLLELKKG
jgi:hypothetical protein